MSRKLDEAPWLELAPSERLPRTLHLARAVPVGLSVSLRVGMTPLAWAVARSSHDVHLTTMLSGTCLLVIEGAFFEILPEELQEVQRFVGSVFAVPA